MPGTGPLDVNQKWEIEIELQGGLAKSDADKFDADLKAFITSHKQALKVTWKSSKKV